MADTFKGIITADGKKRQLPYENVLKTPVSDETLSIQGAFADAKAAGDKFKEVKVETDSLKEDLDNYGIDLRRIDFREILVTKDSGGSKIVKVVLRSGQKYTIENDTNTATNVQIRKNNSSDTISNLGNIRGHEKIEFVSNISGTVDFLHIQQIRFV